MPRWLVYNWAMPLRLSNYAQKKMSLVNSPEFILLSYKTPTRKCSCFRIYFPWQVPTSPIRSEYRPSYNQEPLLTLQSIAESTAKAVAAQQRSLDPLANSTCCTWINISGKAETQLHKITKQAPWIKKGDPPSVGSFFDLFDFDLSVSWGPWL